LFHGKFVGITPESCPRSKKCHLIEYPGAFACFAQFVHNQFSAIFAIF
jgi:hypothetical protein